MLFFRAVDNKARMEFGGGGRDGPLLRNTPRECSGVALVHRAHNKRMHNPSDECRS